MSEVENLFIQANRAYQNGEYLEALLKFLNIYSQTEDTEVLQGIKELYYYPDKEYLRRQYDKNIRLLENYPYYFTEEHEEFEEICILWYDNVLLIYLDGNDRVCIRRNKEINIEDMQDETILLREDEFWDANFDILESKTTVKELFLDRELPFYAAFGKTEWKIFLMISERMEYLLQKDRIVFLVGKPACYRYFSRPMVRCPQMIIGDDSPNYEGLINRVVKEKNKSLDDNYKFIVQYYREHKDGIWEHIKSGTPKILAINNRFTTALQYHARDCMEAARLLGCQAEILIEENRLSIAEPGDYLEKIREQLPDIIFLIDNFRFNIGGLLPPEIVVVSWIQDPLQHIMDSETPKKLGANDIVLSHYNNWQEIKNLEYEKYVMFIEAPIPANDEKYKKYPLTEKERAEYTADICMVCHAANLDEEIELLCSWSADIKWRSFVLRFISDYYHEVYEMGDFYYSRQQFKDAISVSINKYLGENVALYQSLVELAARAMYLKVNQIIYRNVLADWLLDAGYTNIKLWGNGWRNNKKYEKYAMGAAPNGEVLSKIYQCSKINIGNNIMTSAAARAWECMLSGGFYLSNYIPPEQDTVDIRKIVTLDEEVACFYSKEDFLYKIDYYLSHEKERQRMIERGREVTLERMTYKKLMKKLFDEMKKER